MKDAQRPVFLLEKPKPLWQHHAMTILVGLLLLGTCIQVYQWVQGDQQEPSNAGAYSIDAHFWGRSYKIRILEQQLAEREGEVQYLQGLVERAVLAIKTKETNLEAADHMIRMLRDREESDRSARGRAQYALAEKVSELNSCITRRVQIETQLATCSKELLMLTRQARDDPIVPGSGATETDKTAGMSEMMEVLDTLTTRDARTDKGMAAAATDSKTSTGTAGAASTGTQGHSQPSLGRRGSLPATTVPIMAAVGHEHEDVVPATMTATQEEMEDDDLLFQGVPSHDVLQAQYDAAVQAHQQYMEIQAREQARQDRWDDADPTPEGIASHLEHGKQDEPRSAFIPHQANRRRALV